MSKPHVLVKSLAISINLAARLRGYRIKTSILRGPDRQTDEFSKIQTLLFPVPSACLGQVEPH